LSWQMRESRYFRIYYQDPSDLVRLTHHLFKGGSKETAQRIKKSGVVEDQDLRIYDDLYEETMNLIGMRNTERLSIRIYPSYAALSEEYERLANRRDSIIAFYNQRVNVICLDAYATRSVLGHEMVHALADQIFTPDPPVEVQELLAAYVQARI